MRWFVRRVNGDKGMVRCVDDRGMVGGWLGV